MTDGYLNFDTKINTKGFENGIKNIDLGLEKLKSELSKIGILAASVFSISQISAFAKECKSLYNVQLEAESRLEAIAKNNLGATDEQIQSLKDYASELQNIGIIGDEVQLSGMQELSTYIENVDNLKPLMSVLDDMLAQQYGFNATAESAVAISTMLGKVLSGQTSALSRYGYTFDENQEKLLKFGTEEQRVATLAEVVSASVGGVNEALAKTPTGQMQQLSNTIGDIKEQFGSAFTQIEVIFLPALQKIADFMAGIASKAEELAKSLSKFFGIDSTEIYGIGANKNIEAATISQNEFTEAIKETEKAQKNSLAAFDKLNILQSENDEEKADNSAISPTVAPVISEKSVDDAIDEISEKLKNFLMPIKIAWDDNSDEFISNAEHAINAVKSLFSSIGQSIEKVWENGSAERFFDNIFGLFGGILGIIGDVSNALENAWNDDGRGEKLIQSYIDKWNELLEIFRLFIEDFRTAWNNGTGEKICGNLLEIITNINNTTANLRENFKNAWAENNVGESIFQGILNIISAISETAKNITFSTSEWAKDVDFSPFIESVDSLLQAVEPFTETIGKGLEDFYNDVLLPLASWTIEELIPTFLENLGKAIDGLNSAWNTASPILKDELFDKFLKPIAEFTAETLIDTLNKIGDSIQWLGNSLDVEQYNAIFTFLKGLGAIFLVVKAYPIIESATAALSSFGFTLSSIASTLGSVATLSLGTVFTGITAFLASFTLTKSLLQWFGIDKVLENFGGKLYDFFNETLPEICENTFYATIEIIGTFSDTVWGFFGDLWENIKDIFSGVGEYFKEKFQAAWDNISAAFSEFTEYFTQKWADIKKNLSEIANWFKNKFDDAWKNITAIFSEFSNFFTEKWKNIKKNLAEIATWFKNKFDNAWKNITSIFDGFSKYFAEKWNEIKEKLSDIGEYFKEKFQSAWDNITTIFSDFSGYFGNKWDDIKNKFSDVGEYFREKFQSAWDNITSVFASPETFFNEVWTTIKGCFSHVSDWFKDTFSEAWQAVKNVFSSGGEIFGGITTGIFETFKSVVNSLIDGINSVISVPFSAINGALDGIRGITILDYTPFEWLPSISIPEIPKLATGTVVPANYGEFLAVLGDNKREPEIVSPVSEIEKAVTRAMNKNSKMPDKIEVCIYLDRTLLKREVINIMNEDLRNRGG